MNNYDEIERKIFLIKNYLEDNLSVAEEEELRVWLDESPKHRETFQRIRDKKILFAKLEYRQRQEKETDWKVICRKTGIGSSRRLWYIRVARYAAVFFGLCLGVWLYFRAQVSQPQESTLAAISMDTICPGYKQAYIELKSGERIALGNTGNKQEKRIEGMVLKEEKDGVMILPGDSLADKAVAVEKSWIVVPRGGEYQLILPDGTKVWLNSASKLEFPNTFVGDERRVKLAGEAYFEVAKNKAKPFRVEVDRVEVVVLGTSFNIHAYDEAVKTTLVEGAVKLNVAGKAYSLSPGFEANVDQGGVKIVKSDVYEQIAWKDGRFVFREKRLEEVMSILSRWYDFEIFYQNAAVKDLHFTGNIPRHATINEVLKFLERTHLVHFSVVGRTVIVSE